MQMKEQRYYHIMEKVVVTVDDSNYYTTFPHQKAVDYYMILRDDEQVLLDMPDKIHPNINVIMTNKAVMVWIFEPTYEEIISIYRLSTDEHSHFELLNTLPDELHLMTKHYEELSTTRDMIQRATLLSHIKKAKPRKRMKGKYKDVHN